MIFLDMCAPSGRQLVFGSVLRGGGWTKNKHTTAAESQRGELLENCSRKPNNKTEIYLFLRKQRKTPPLMNNPEWYTISVLVPMPVPVRVCFCGWHPHKMAAWRAIGPLDYRWPPWLPPRRQTAASEISEEKSQKSLPKDKLWQSSQSHAPASN